MSRTLCVVCNDHTNSHEIHNTAHHHHYIPPPPPPSPPPIGVAPKPDPPPRPPRADRQGSVGGYNSKESDPHAVPRRPAGSPYSTTHYCCIGILSHRGAAGQRQGQGLGRHRPCRGGAVGACTTVHTVRLKRINQCRAARGYACTAGGVTTVCQPPCIPRGHVHKSRGQAGPDFPGQEGSDCAIKMHQRYPETMHVQMYF